MNSSFKLFLVALAVLAGGCDKQSSCSKPKKAVCTNAVSKKKVVEVKRIKKACGCEKILFDNASCKLTDSEKAKLNDLLHWMHTYNNVSVLLEGHASAVGNPKFNKALSNRRVNAVKKYLVDNGVNADRVETSHYGASMLPGGQGNDAHNRVVMITKFSHEKA